jgi:uncharacterized protein YecE (DUF72 family)
MSFTVGTSGWYYDEWVGPFYKQKKRMLSYYTKVFNTTEINSTFYRYPSPRMVEGWYKTAPIGFVYAVKLPQLITHDKWLRIGQGVEDDTIRFLNLIQPLAEKLGPILIQLRPKFNYHEHVGVLENYLERLPGNYEWAAEFRHKSWMRPETLKILEQNEVAFTIVDEPLLPPVVHVTTDFAYIRWHGHGVNPWYNYDYNPDELNAWIPKIEETRGKVKRVYGYFNNHFSANAVKNAVELLEMLGSATSEQNSALKKIVDYREKTLHTTHLRTLENFTFEEENGLSVSDKILRFTTSSRLSRGEKINDSELIINVNMDDLIKADIRKYQIELNGETKTIKHDCDDWKKGMNQKRMCKHLAKLFLNLPHDQSNVILSEIWENIDTWKFLHF